ncbi:MAG: nucleoside monophosphate kinase [Parcubacteria group bacterium]
MNIIILGPQGSGKGTQAEMLTQKYNLEHLDVGGTLRELSKMDTPLGKEIYNVLNVAKGLISDEILFKVLRLKLSSLPREQGVIFDGAPRNLEQAKYLEILLREFGKKIDKVFFVNISEEESTARISKRWICQKCRAVLIMGKDVQSEKDQCPACDAPIAQRKDDTPEGIGIRLRIFQEETVPVINYYKEKGLLVEIDGKQPIEKVFNGIVKNIDV